MRQQNRDERVRKRLTILQQQLFILCVGGQRAGLRAETGAVHAAEMHGVVVADLNPTGLTDVH